MGVATMRLLPVAPFTIVNLVSGAFQVRFRDYIIGTLLGMAPGIVVINLFAQQFESAVRNPGSGELHAPNSIGCVGSLGHFRVATKTSQCTH